MEFVYERCGHCGRRGAYLVPGKDLVRCKYCYRWTATTGTPGPDLADAATRLKALLTSTERPPAPGSRPGPGPAAPDELPPAARPAGGVWRIDAGALALLASSAVRPPPRSRRPRTAGAPAPEPVRPARAPGEPPRVLVVDDDEQVRALVMTTLRRAGFEVAEAGDGPEALEAVVADAPDLVILDLSLPGMDGLALLVELRRRCDAGIVVLSGRAEEGDRVVGLELGADDYLGKPFSRDELVARARAVVRRRVEAAAG